VTFVDLLTSEEGVFDILGCYPSLKNILKPIKIFDQIQLYTQLINQPENLKLQREILPESPDRKNLPEALKVGSEHQVIITAYENGPRNFSVRFVSSFHDKFEEFRKLLNDAMLIPLHCEPVIGGIYLSESVADANASESKAEIVRVLVKEIHHDLILVSSIDYGWSRIINVTNLYEISQSFKKTPPFASQFVLESIESITHLNDEELNFYFQYITKNHRLKLRVVHSEGEMQSFIQIQIIISFFNSRRNM
jgi:Tudor domain